MCPQASAPSATDPLVEERILAIRDEPPEGLRRTPGPEAILYYLPRDQELQAAAVSLPRSSRTIYRILKKHGRIPERRPRQHEPQERNAPMTAWQADFKDVSSVAADPTSASDNRVWKRSTSSTVAPRCSSMPRCARISPLKWP